MKNGIALLAFTTLIGGCGDPPRNRAAEYEASSHFKDRVAACIQRTGGNEDSCKLEGMVGIGDWEKWLAKQRKS